MDLSYKRNQFDAQAEVPTVSLSGVGNLNCDDSMIRIMNFEENNNLLVTPLLTPKNASKNHPDPPASNISPPAKRIRTRSAVRGSTKPFSFANQSADFIYPLTGLLGRSSQNFESENSKSGLKNKASKKKEFAETKNESVSEPIVIQVNKLPESNEKMFQVKKKKDQVHGAVELKKNKNKTKSKIITRYMNKKEVHQYAPIRPKISNVPPVTETLETKKKHPPKIVAKSTEGLKILSDYEKRIQQNIDERKRIFDMLKLNEAKLALKETFGDDAPTEALIEVPPATPILPPTPSPPVTLILPPAPLPPALVVEERTPKIQSRRLLKPVRRSLRAYLKPKLERVEPTPRVNQTEKPSIKLILDKEDRADYMRNLLHLLKIENANKNLAPVKSRDELDAFIRKLNGFTLARDDVNVVTMDEIYSLSWHPSNSKLLLAAGDKLGNIGFWDVDSGNDVYGGVRIYDIHTHPVFSLSFDQTNPSRIWSTSYDFLHSLDLNHSSFEEVFSVDAVGDTVTTYHVQNCPSTILVSQSNGEVMVVDTRTSYPPAIRFKCLDGNIRSLSKHPMQDHVFLAASSRNGMGVFDLRALTNQPLVSFPDSVVTVRGASFSPVSGRLVLQNSGTFLSHSITTIFNVQSSQQARRVTTVNHSNVHFSARSEWHPQREDVFISGGVDPLSSVDMFDASNGQVVHQFLSMNLKSLCPINSFHPSVPVLACGNRLGRVHVFRPPR